MSSPANTPESALSRECLESLRRFDTCTLSNAIECLRAQALYEESVIGTARCVFPELLPVVGYAVTGRIRSSIRSVSEVGGPEQIDWWRFVASISAPRLVVLQDSDPFPGTAAMFGAMHAQICRALECVAYLTNGAVRDLPSIEALGFQLFAGNVSVSRGYARVVEYGAPVEIGGLHICTGDLLHGDLHGVHKIPLQLVHDLPAVAERLLRRNRDLFRFCDQREFSVDRLAQMLEEQEGVGS